MPITWTSDLNTGIDVIDKQHMRIVDFINELEVALKSKDKHSIKAVVDDCVDYTLSHFAFEESLQEEAGYQYCKPHKKVHELFTRKVAEYQERLDLGDDIGAVVILRAHRCDLLVERHLLGDGLQRSIGAGEARLA